jgi:isopentenyldiphosphate isomerase
LASLCVDYDEIRDAVLAAGLFTSQDLGALGMDVEAVARSLDLSAPARAAFASVFAIAKARVDGSEEERMRMMLDVLNAEGHLIMRRPRVDVHRGGFWHRAINVWVVCTSTSRVLIGQRTGSKDMDPRKWTCVCGRVPSGDLSMNAAVDRLAVEFSIHAETEKNISLHFSMKCARKITKGVFAGQTDGAWVDVYLACLDDEIPIERVHLDVRAKQSAKYVTLDELERAYQIRDETFVIPSNGEYAKKLLHYLRKACK